MMTKHTCQTPVISITMRMRRCNEGCIARWSTSRASQNKPLDSPAGKCLRHIAPVAAMVNNFNAKHKALTKTIFS
jgi:hypothetical protein